MIHFTLVCMHYAIHTCMNMNVKSVAEVKEIASQLGQPGSPCVKVEVHNIEVSSRLYR